MVGLCGIWWLFCSRSGMVRVNLERGGRVSVIVERVLRGVGICFNKLNWERDVS